MARFSRRNHSQAAAPAAGARIVLASFRPTTEGFEKLPADPAAAGLVTLALPNGNAAELLESTFHQQRFDDLGDAAKARVAAFAKAIAGSPDSRLRRAAAGYEGLEAAEAEVLARDPAGDVRTALSQNHHAVLRLAPATLVEFCGVEPELIRNVTSELSRPDDEDDVEACRERIKAIEAALAVNPDQSVRTDARAYVARFIERFEEAAGEKKRPRFIDLRSRHQDDPVFSEPLGEYVWVLGFAGAEGGDGWLADDAPVMPLARTIFESSCFGCWLPEGSASEEVLDRLALERSYEIRGEIARREDIPAAAAKRLIADPVREVRSAVLENEAATEHLSDEEILAAIGGDPYVIEDLCEGFPGERIAKLIAAKFAGHADPRVAEAIAGLDLEEDAEA